MATKPKVDSTEKKLRDQMAADAKKYGTKSDQYIKSRTAVNDYLRSQGKTTNSDTEAGKPSNYVAPPTPNLPGQNNITTSGAQGVVQGTGEDLITDKNGNTGKAIDNLFGSYGKAGKAAGDMYTNLVPLTQIDATLSPDQIAAMQGLKGASEAAAVKDPRQEMMLDQFLKNSQQGMGQPALTALKEEGMGGIESQLQGVLRQLALRNGGSGISGPATTIGQNPAIAAALQARRGLERDVMAKDIDFRQTNLEQGSLAANRARDSYFSNLSQAGQNYWTGATQGAAQVIDSQKWNADSELNYGLGKAGAITGGADWAAQEAHAKKAEELSGKAIAAASSGAAGGGGSAGYSGTSQNGGSSLSDSYKNMVKKQGTAPNYG